MNKTLFIAEIGGNHKGDFELAKSIVKDCLLSEADIIKLQLYSADGLVNEKYDPNRHQHFKKFELTKTQYIKLAKMIKDEGKLFCASVWDLQMMDWIKEYVDVWKIGSGDFTSLPIIKNVLKENKLTILSTGLCNIHEVDEVMNYCNKNCLSENIILMQCTSMYPIPDSEANLSVVNLYKEKYGIKVGYSDHTMGCDALKIALSMGVAAVEFHYTLNKADTSFRDNLVSLNRLDVNELHHWKEKVYLFMGNQKKSPTTSELNNQHISSFRRGVYANRKIKKGEIINLNDIVLLRPYIEGGLSPLELVEEFKLKSSKDYDYLELI